MKSKLLLFRYVLALTVTGLLMAGAMSVGARQSSSPRPAAFDYDPGVDYALANSKSVMFSGPSVNQSRIMTVVPGNIYFIVPIRAVKGWYDVIDYTTGQEGWVKSTRLDVFKTETAPETVNFSHHPAVDSHSPKITLHSDSKKPIRVRLDDRSFLIAPHQDLVVTVPAGLYSYYVVVPLAVPHFGTRQFEADAFYTWSLTENDGR